MRLRMRQLEALMAVAETGSMTRAAEDLGISQPAVSRLLSDLSTQIGFQLFQRRDGVLTPTQEARFLLPDIQRVLERLDHIGELSRNLTERKAGHLKVACLPGFATSHLPDVLSAFLEERPGVTVTIEPDRPERIMEWMLNEQYDLGITDGFEGHPAVQSETIDLRTVCIFPEGHRFADMKVVRATDLVEEKIIHTRRDSPFYRAFQEAIQSRGVAINSLVEIRQFTAACELVSRGLGVSVISELDAEGYRNRGVRFRPFEPRIPHRLAIVRPTHKDPSLVMMEFMDMFRESLARYRL
ncbi:LysR family transcriptional regulator [Hwanghaeella grinnelliae]|uniref:LysR family transcriptional regulator n=1 Tax=Hwanghaeella grinnelliae TaxID=2500179 RepID=A0A3S2VSM0_9PROT|nr:LysR substrate-binding domain-containing protein [Hwanghaeella grinnelliae]RVU39554.1 LysR family transcriptional regulator [Hwanghaeella grinnelliae]